MAGLHRTLPVLLAIALWAGEVMASELECKGVTFRYPDGMGVGNATREADTRRVTLDTATQRLVSETVWGERSGVLEIDAQAYHAVLPLDERLYGVRLRAERVEIERASRAITATYLPAGAPEGTGYLAFLGRCAEIAPARH